MAAKVDPEKCDGCGSCVEVCPTSAVELKEKATVKADDCIDCNACQDACTHDAIHVEA